MNGGKTVFLSYAHRDQAKVKDLYAKLKAAGFRPWMDDEDLKGGEDWAEAIRKAVRSCDYFIACLSQESVSRRGVIQKEIKDALDVRREKLNSDIYLIPVKLEACEIPESLSAIQCVDLYRDGGLERLARAMGGDAPAEPRPRRKWLWPVAAAVAALALSIGLWMAWPGRHTSAAAEFTAARNPAVEQPAGPPRIGVTLWRLRPSNSSDPAGIRMLVQEPAAPEPAAWTPERLDPDAPIREGDRLRIGIESQQPGFLYVIDRESYQGGKTGDPFLIFPTFRMSAGANEMRHGRLVEIPSADDRPPYLTVRSQAPGYRGELLTILLSPQPIPELLAAGDRRPIGLSFFQELDRRWPAKFRKEQSHSGVGNAITPAETAARSSTRLLVQEDPAPQTIYTFDSPADQPRLFHFTLTAAK